MARLLPNGRPTIAVPGSQTAYEDVDQTIGGILVGDPDGDLLTVSLSVNHGTLTLANTSGLTVTGNGSNRIELYGSIAGLNLALAGLVYRGGLNHSGADSLSISVGDGSMSATAVLSIHVKSAAEQAEDLETLVNDLLAAGVLTAGQAEALIVDIRNNRGDIGRVQAFINKVNAFHSAGILSADLAAMLSGLGNILLLSVTRQ